MYEPNQPGSCELRRKRTEDHGHAPAEMSKIITDPATGKCYCRGKVLGKVAISELQQNANYAKTIWFFISVYFGNSTLLFQSMDTLEEPGKYDYQYDCVIFFSGRFRQVL